MKLLKRHHLGTLLPWSLVAVMLALNVALITQNLHMRSGPPRAIPQPLNDGEIVHGFTGVGMLGQSVEILYNSEGPSHIFLFLSPHCPFCSQQLPYWRELVKKIDPRGFTTTVLVSDSIDRNEAQSYLEKNGLSSGLNVIFVPDTVIKNYKLVATPITLVVSNDGTVKKHWVGKWDEPSLNSASAFFGMAFSQ